MTVNDAINKINEMEQNTKNIRQKMPNPVGGNDEITLTYHELISLLADRQELIDIYKRMSVNYV